MKRRSFISNVAVLSTGTAIIPSLLTANTSNRIIGSSLKGFIVSDAHFGWAATGWAKGMQPSPEQQQQAMDNIMNRFPDLDMFIDTGDAHHNDHHNNSNPYKARKDWVDIIQGGCGQLPFFYVIGNHEIRSNEDADPEMRSSIMGSNSCRPYYSFDINGIHFISFPELIRAIFITKEEWDWLELDLSLNRDKTVIMLSHNNIIGTTSGNEPGYRGIMDSDKMLQVFKKNPNVISWMHGHNHNYEIVNHQNMLFVSNGRIGGFDPSGGKHGIGGIYFEISANGILVRCYSAEKDCFLDTLDSSLSQELKTQTSLNSEIGYAYSYGVGGAVNGERIPAFHHHVGEKSKTELFLTGCDHAIINDDPSMTKYTERKAYHGLDKILYAGKVNHGNEGYEYLNPGIRLKANDNWWTTLTMPSDNYDKYSYFRCPVGKKYKVSIDLNIKVKGTQKLWLRLHVYDIDGRKLRVVQSEEISLGQGPQELERIIEVPDIDNFETIYNNPESNNLVNIAVEASFTGMDSDVEIFNLTLTQENESQNTIDAGVIIDEKKYQLKGLLEKGKIEKIPVDGILKTRSVNEIIAGGNKRVTYLIKHSDLKWQVRNATATFKDDCIVIDKIRNHISDKMEIIIAPLQKTNEPYLQRIRRAECIKFYPFNSKKRTIKINVDKVYTEAEIEVYSPTAPRQIKGVDKWNYEGNIITAKINKASFIQFDF